MLFFYNYEKNWSPMLSILSQMEREKTIFK